MPRLNQQGYIALIAVLIIVAVTLSIGISLNLLSISETQTGLLKQQSAMSYAIADSCLQEAILQIERDKTYAGANLNVGLGSCTITVVSQATDRIITVESNVNNIVRRLEASVDVSAAEVSLNYWQEIN